MHFNRSLNRACFQLIFFFNSQQIPPISNNMRTEKRAAIPHVFGVPVICPYRPSVCESSSIKYYKSCIVFGRKGLGDSRSSLGPTNAYVDGLPTIRTTNLAYYALWLPPLLRITAWIYTHKLNIKIEPPQGRHQHRSQIKGQMYL